MRATFLLLVAVGCASAPGVRVDPYPGATCEQRCIYRARQCREDAVEETSGTFGLRSLVHTGERNAMLSNCAETKAECFQLCGGGVGVPAENSPDQGSAP